MALVLGLKTDDDEVMSNCSSVSYIQKAEDEKFSQVMAGKALSPAVRAQQEKPTRKNTRAASRSNTLVACQIFDYYCLDHDSQYYHGLCREMVVAFVLRYGTDTNGRKEMLLKMEICEFPPICKSTILRILRIDAWVDLI